MPDTPSSQQPEISYSVKDLLDQINAKIDKIDTKLDSAIRIHEERIDSIEHRVSVHGGIFKAFGMILGALSAILVWLHR